MIVNRRIVHYACATMFATTAIISGASAQITKSEVPFIVTQPTNEWLVRVFIGAKVQNTSGEIVGDVNDLIFDKSGRIGTVVLGVGGILGVGEKNVAIPFSALTFSVNQSGARVITVPLSADALKQAPVFAATEKTTLDAIEDKALELGKKTSEKAGQLKDQALKKLDEMKTDDPQNPSPKKP
jgi:sporulation protein YlmC with PRC-barrel domain